MATGHITKKDRKNGDVSYQITVETEPDVATGKRNRIYKTLKGTKKEAEKVMRDMLLDLDNQAFIKDSKVLVKTFLKEWLEIYIKPHKSPTTVDNYTLHVEKYLIPALGNKKLQNLKTIDIQKFYNQLQISSPIHGKPLSAKTIRNIHMSLQSALEKAVEQNIIPKNPAKTAVLPKVKRYEADVYSMEEVKELFRAVKGTDLELAVHILILLGLRRGELLALRWKNVDLEKGFVSITENAVCAENKVIIKEPKSESGKRKIDMPQSLTQMMKKAKAGYLENKLKQGKEFIDRDLVICHLDGTPYTPTAFSKKVHGFLERKGLKKIRLHDFRHAYVKHTPKNILVFIMDLLKIGSAA